MAAPRTLPSVCPLDCPDTCSLAAEVADGRLVKVRGSKANPYTAGVICNKVARHYPDFVHGAARLTHPLQRTGPRGSGLFERISWGDALDRIHAGFSRAMAEHGPQSVLPFNYAGPHGELAGGSMDRRFFHRLGASFLSRGPLCGLVRGAAYASLYGTAPGMPPEQLRHSDLIVVWGNNVTVSNLHLMRAINAARQANGAKLVVIDPKRTKVAEQADLHIAIHPGTDVVLALGLAAELERRGAHDRAFIDRWVEGYDAYMAEARKVTRAQVFATCRIAPEQFDALAGLYCTRKTIGVSVGNGIERGASGGSGIRAAMALQALTGQHGRKGAGVFAKPGNSFPKTTARLQRPDLAPAGTRTINIVDVGRLLQDQSGDPPIRALMIYNHNPVATHPDQNLMRRALAREDVFVCGADVVMTDSMAYCDVVLPAASHFEFADIYGAYGQQYLQRAEPVIPCVGESLPNTEIFRRLAARFGFNEPLFRATDAELMDDAFADADPRLEGFKPSAVPLDRAIAMTAPGGRDLILCDTLPPGTASGRITLFNRDLEDRFGFGLPRYAPPPQDRPLVLISPSSDKRTNATFGASAASDGLERLEINPADAAARGIADGQTVRLYNARGEVHLRARVTDAVRPGVVYSPKGTWLRTSPTGQTVNALLPSDVRTDIEDGACYNETFCDLEPA
ncbi:MAG: molybdopterin oxidoreductase family protein [Alphaproteobacteria bacterium]|nr:molybdopterin oxidoreductase family protein [Alphaproteobacteria bacterium]MCB9929764.1 molybdopterin oxidoreductase family protein [Alphaproteobacteria bacterium]